MSGFQATFLVQDFLQNIFPSFGWGGSESMKEYKLVKAIETAKAVFARRDKKFNTENVKLFEYIFNLTKEDRAKRGY